MLAATYSAYVAAPTTSVRRTLVTATIQALHVLLSVNTAYSTPSDTAPTFGSSDVCEFCATEKATKIRQKLSDRCSALRSGLRPRHQDPPPPPPPPSSSTSLSPAAAACSALALPLLRCPFRLPFL